MGVIVVDGNAMTAGCAVDVMDIASFSVGLAVIFMRGEDIDQPVVKSSKRIKSLLDVFLLSKNAVKLIIVLIAIPAPMKNYYLWGRRAESHPKFRRVNRDKTKLFLKTHMDNQIVAVVCLSDDMLKALHHTALAWRGLDRIQRTSTMVFCHCLLYTGMRSVRRCNGSCVHYQSEPGHEEEKSIILRHKHILETYTNW